MTLSWLDTQTKAILQGSDPPKASPSLEADFSLILLDGGQNVDHFRRALSRILDLEELENLEIFAEKSCPFVIRSSMTYGDASLGQFELICANAVSIIVRDEVALDGEPDYLKDLFQTLRQSNEFQLVTLSLLALPSDERGRNFCDQFLGGPEFLPPITLSTTRKKSRIMQHWAQKIGVRLEIPVEK